MKHDNQVLCMIASVSAVPISAFSKLVIGMRDISGTSFKRSKQPKADRRAGHKAATIDLFLYKRAATALAPASFYGFEWSTSLADNWRTVCYLVSDYANALEGKTQQITTSESAIPQSSRPRMRLGDM